MYSIMWNISCLLFVLGLLCLLVGEAVKLLFHQNGPYTARAQAKVVDIVVRPRRAEASLSEFRNNQIAVFEFFANGRPVKVDDTADTYPCPYHINQSVTICYNPEKPEQFCIASHDMRRLVTRALGAGGVVLILAGCALFLMYAARV